MALEGDLCNIVVVAVVLISSFEVCFGLGYMVGGSVWSIPPYPDFYTNWSSSIVFYIGDSLVFEFESEFFNVIQVSRLDYESCTSTNPVKILTISPAIVILSEEGVFYYICNISNYCNLGQKVSIVVNKHSTDFQPSLSPSPLPMPSPSSSPPLPPLAPSLVPFLAPEQSQAGQIINLSQSPVPWNTISPSLVICGNSNGARAGNMKILGVSSRGMIFGWACALCFRTLFVLM